ncbi:MAG: VCBS repeat-containing protein [Myxococcota bacterium]
MHRAGPQGLPIEPTRRIPLAPFDEELERRHESTLHQTHLALDVDGDARADLMLASLGGGLMDGQSRLRIHLGRGDGVAGRCADAVRERRGGFAGWSFADLDGDGRQELIETSVEVRHRPARTRPAPRCRVETMVGSSRSARRRGRPPPALRARIRLRARLRPGRRRRRRADPR